MNDFVLFLLWIVGIVVFVWLGSRLLAGLLLAPTYLVDFFKKAFGKKEKKEPEQWYEYEQYDYHPSTVHYFSEKFRYNSVPEEILRLREGESQVAYVKGDRYCFTCVSCEWVRVGSSYYDESEAYAMEKEGRELGVLCYYIKVEEV